MSRLRPLGLEKRIMLYVSAGLIVLLGTFAFLVHRAIQQSIDAILQERLSFAVAVAREIDQLIVHLQAEMVRHAEALGPDPGDGLTAAQEGSLSSLYSHLAEFHRFQLPGGLLLTDAGGRVLWSRGGTSDFSVDSMPDPYLPPALGTGGARVIAEDVFMGRGQPVVWLSAPVGEGQSHITGLLLTAVAPVPESPAFASFRPLPGRQLELVSREGHRVIGSAVSGQLEQSPHLQLVGSLLESGQAGIKRHVSSSLGDTSSEHVVAFAPLSQVPWGVMLEEPEDAVTALPAALQRQMYLLSGSALLVGLLAAWITARQVVKPLVQLTAKCRRIAEGDIDTPIAVTGQDEIRELARSFEIMRNHLKQSLDKIEQWNRDLEGRVRQRTDELEQRNRERSVLLEKLVVAQEEERKRVARELHDEIGQALTALVMHLGGVEQVLTSNPEKARDRLVSLRLLTSKTTDEVRRLISDLRPSVLDDMGLVAALRSHAENHLDTAGIKVTLRAGGLDGRLPAHIEVAVFRIVQEAMNNILRHARASSARIDLDTTDSVIRGSVADDGIGFDVTAERPGMSAGLLGMEERCSRLGGRLAVDSQPGKGTTVRFEIPFDGEKRGKDQNLDR